MSLRFLLINKKESLLELKNSILELFKTCFERVLPEGVWDWAYLENPYRDPIASLCFNEDNVLIGHYAVIPLMLKNNRSRVCAGLSMTTMVLSSYRKYGLFVEQAEQVYQEAARQGFQLIIGFPNKNSAPGFKKRLGWQLQDNYVVTLSGAELIKNRKFNDNLGKNDLLEIDFGDAAFKHWRLSKPQVSYQDKGSVILKEYKGGADLVYMTSGYENSLEKGRLYNILLEDKTGHFSQQQYFEYQFGYKVLDETKIGAFKKDLILSDVF